MAKKIPLSAASKKVLDEFDDCAQSWGYLSDRGVGNEVKNSEEAYNEARAALEKRIRRLETDARAIREYRAGLIGAPQRKVMP